MFVFKEEFSQYNDHFESSGVGFGASLFIHALFLLILFMMIVTPDTHKLLEPASRQAATTIAAPVILYSGPTPQPHKTVTAQPGSKGGVGTPGTQGASTSTAPKQPLKTAEQTTPIPPKPVGIPSTEKKEPTKQATTKEKEQTPFLEKTEAPSLFKAVEQTTPADGQKKQAASKEEIRRHKLTLADLFQTMPHLMQAANQAAQSGDGDTLVISQGDMKYYTFLKKFITHINEVFTFYGGPQKIDSWMKEGLIRKNTSMSVVIDKKGNVLEVILTGSSGYQPFDELSIQAVHQASPFPPVPEYLNHEKVRVELMSYI